jgi:hypothetical protein
MPPETVFPVVCDALDVPCIPSPLVEPYLVRYTGDSLELAKKPNILRTLREAESGLIGSRVNNKLSGASRRTQRRCRETRRAPIRCKNSAGSRCARQPMNDDSNSLGQTPQRGDPQIPVNATNQVVVKFSHLYSEAAPRGPVRTPGLMRDIILGREVGSANTIHARRSEKRMIEACERRILEFPLAA